MDTSSSACCIQHSCQPDTIIIKTVTNTKSLELSKDFGCKHPKESNCWWEVKTSTLINNRLLNICFKISPLRLLLGLRFCEGSFFGFGQFMIGKFMQVDLHISLNTDLIYLIELIDLLCLYVCWITKELHHESASHFHSRCNKN